jgi:hypothetical protein
MGLDMYLDQEFYVQNWDHYPVEQRHTIAVVQGDTPRADIDTSKITAIIVRAGYWRKANQIHKWFVENVQDGVDDCKRYYVDDSQLQALLRTVNEVLADPSKAAELLPREQGFFFGSDDYDEWYIRQLQETKEIIEALNLDAEGSMHSPEYYYRASW